jgi:D,D-heptose 1,7-bisphosphate phosphatase
MGVMTPPQRVKGPDWCIWPDSGRLFCDVGVHRLDRGSVLRPGRKPRASRRRPARPGILLDRDGTIIVDHGYVGSVDRVEFIDGAPQAIARFNRAGIPIAVVTNQAGVARGLYGPEDVEVVHQHIARELAGHDAHVDLFLFCPYHPDGVVEEFRRASDSRKPGPGMATAAAEILKLDLTQSWVVGDSAADIGLAEAVGASAVYLGPEPCEHEGVWWFPSLAASASFLLERVAA